MIPLNRAGGYHESKEWLKIRKTLDIAITSIDWHPGTGRFVIYPESGKRRGEGNGVKPIKVGLMVDLKRQGWETEKSAKTALNQAVGNFDAVLSAPTGLVVLE